MYMLKEIILIVFIKVSYTKMERLDCDTLNITGSTLVTGYKWLNLVISGVLQCYNPTQKIKVKLGKE